MAEEKLSILLITKKGLTFPRHTIYSGVTMFLLNIGFQIQKETNSARMFSESTEVPHCNDIFSHPVLLAQ